VGEYAYAAFLFFVFVGRQLEVEVVLIWGGGGM